MKGSVIGWADLSGIVVGGNVGTIMIGATIHRVSNRLRSNSAAFRGPSGAGVGFAAVPVAYATG